MDNKVSWRLGKMLDGRYEMISVLGIGGMAVVYKAFDHKLKRNVAIKVLRDDVAVDTQSRKRFRTESQAVAMLSHANIMGVYDVGHADGVDYIVMELIDGITDLILETVVGTQPEVLIASSRYPAEVVRSKFLKLNYFHIEYVLNCLKQNTTKVKNIRKYLLAMLFNAPSTMEGYYQAEVNHDMPQYAAAR